MRLKKAIKIAGGIIGGLFLVVYFLIAICLLMPVQTVAGVLASSYFSSEWGGKVRVARLAINPLGSIGLGDIELISPTNDTIFICEHLGVRFHKMPINDEGLQLDQVSISNAYYHLEVKDSVGINLQYIIQYFQERANPDTTIPAPFIVKVKRLLLNNVEYRMDLDDHGHSIYPDHGVCYMHQHYYEVRANISNIRVNADDINCRIQRFSAREQSGFVLKKLSCIAKVSPYNISAQNMDLETDSTHLMLDAALYYNTWDGMSEYLDSVRHTLTLHPGSTVNMRDVGYWAEPLWGLNQQVDVSGYAEGPISNLVVEGFDVDVKRHLSFSVKGSVVGLPDITNTQFNVVVSNLQTSYDALSHVVLPEKVAPVTVPSILKGLEDINANVKVEGTASDCHASASIQSGIGPLEADLTVNREAGKKGYNAFAQISSSSLSLLKIFPNEWVSKTGLRADVQCEGESYATLLGRVEGELYSTVFRGIPIRPATFEASFGEDKKLEANFDIDDELLSLSVSGTSTPSGDKHVIHLDALVNRCALSTLHIVNSDSLSDIATHLRADLRGTQVSDMTGKVSLSNTVFTLNGSSVILNNMLLTLREVNNYKNVMLTSDWLTLSLKGNLAYEELPLLARDFCHRYFPTNLNPWLDEPLVTLVTDADFSFNIRWKGDYEQLNQLSLPLCLASNTSLNGSYSPVESLRMVLRSDSISVGGVALKDVGIIGNRKGDNYNLQVDADRLCVGEPALLEEVVLTATLAPAETKLRLHNGHQGEVHDALMDLTLFSDTVANHVHLNQGRFKVFDKQWQVMCDKDIELSNGRYVLPLLVATDNQQSVEATMSIVGDEDDQIQVSLHNLSFAWLTQLALASSGFNLEGYINGTVSYKGFHATPYLTANLKAKDCKVNDYQLDQMTLRSDWNPDKNLISLNLDTRTQGKDGAYAPLRAKGSVKVNGGSPVLDVNIAFDHFPLETVTPLLSSFASHFEGEMHGDLHAGGPLKQVQFNGKAIIEDGVLGIAATGVTYRFSDTIALHNRRITLSNFDVKDPLNHTLTIDGHILTDGLQVTDMNLKMNGNNFMLFSVPERPDAVSGLVMAALSGQVQGNSNNLVLNISARTSRGSVLSIPVDDRKQVSENQFITFTAPVNSQLKAKRVEKKSQPQSPVSLTLALELTPDLKLKLPMTFQQIAPRLTASGAGNVLLTLKGKEPMVTGSYELTSGSLMLELFSLLSTNFTLDPGSTIILPGDINNAIFDIKASHLVHANLASLMGTSIESAGRTVNVEDVIVLSGTLADPKVSFDIRFPGADKSVEEEVSAYIDRSNERDVFTQAMSLLLTGQFANTASENSMIDNASAGGYNLATSTLGNVVSNVVRVVDVNFGYQGETALTKEQFDIDIRKEWDRLYFETTLGYGGEAIALEGTDATSTNLVGDVLVGYKINPRLHLFVFNRTNTNDFTRTELPYKQGVGLKLTREFNRWGDIFSRTKTSNNQ